MRGENQVRVPVAAREPRSRGWLVWEGRAPWPASPRHRPTPRTGERAFVLGAEEEVALTARGQEGGPGSPWRGAAGGEAARGAGGRAQRRDARPRARPQPLPHSGAPRSSPPGPSHPSPSGDARPGVKLVPQPREGGRGRAGTRAAVGGGRAPARPSVPARPPRPTTAGPAHRRVPPAPPRGLSPAPSRRSPEIGSFFPLGDPGSWWRGRGRPNWGTEGAGLRPGELGLRVHYTGRGSGVEGAGRAYSVELRMCQPPEIGSWGIPGDGK